jgi:hypothetical protein
VFLSLSPLISRVGEEKYKSFKNDVEFDNFVGLKIVFNKSKCFSLVSNGLIGK